MKDWHIRSGFKARERHEVLCKFCGEDDISKLKKDCTRKWGVRNLCRKCEYQRYGKKHYKKPPTKKNRKRNYNRGYTVVEDPTGTIAKGTYIPAIEFKTSLSLFSFADGTIVKRNGDGKLYEVFNKPILQELDE